MNANEPVAWMHKTIPSWVSTFVHPETEPDEWFALYTHPVKELTDEEIYGFTHRMIICSGQNPNAADINIFGLARIVEDILKKAQEK